MQCDISQSEDRVTKKGRYELLKRRVRLRKRRAHTHTPGCFYRMQDGAKQNMQTCEADLATCKLEYTTCDDELDPLKTKMVQLKARSFFAKLTLARKSTEQNLTL